MYNIHYLNPISPKGTALWKEDYEKTLDESLSKLNTDYIDCYHFWGINQKVFDEKIVPLGLTLFVYNLYAKKNWSPLAIMGVILVLAIVLTAIGFIPGIGAYV